MTRIKSKIDLKNGAPVTKEELLQYIEEYRRFARTMPTDPYRRRWSIIADALEVMAEHTV